MDNTPQNIDKKKLLDNSDLYEIPEDRVEAINNDPVNDRKEVSDEDLDVAYSKALALFGEWQKSISPKAPEGNKTILAEIQDIIEEVDRALAFTYTDTMGKPRQMIFKPKRLEALDDKTLKNRLELH